MSASLSDEASGSAANGQPTPRVSVFVVTYNQRRFVAKALRSLYSQTYRDFELIVVDDCSPDDTVAEVQRLTEGTATPVIHHTANVGQYRTYNQLLHLARGEYLLFASGDDVCSPKLLERLVEALAIDTRVGLAFSNVLLIDEQDRALGDLFSRRHEQRWLTHDWRQSGRQVLPSLLQENFVVCIGCVLMRKSAFAALGGFGETLPQAADWDLWLRFAREYDLAYVSEPLLAWRQHGDTVTSRLRRSGQYYEDNIDVLERTLEQLPPDVAMSPAERVTLLAQAHLAAGFGDLAAGRDARGLAHLRLVGPPGGTATGDAPSAISSLLRHGVSLLPPQTSATALVEYVDKAIAGLPRAPADWTTKRRECLARAFALLAGEARLARRPALARRQLASAVLAWPGVVITANWLQALPGAIPFGCNLVSLYRRLRPRRAGGSLAAALDG
ncbi:MAG: glycosyltransferase family 2 protein [Chloroflexota bacterium]